MKQIHAEESIARDSVKRCFEKHRLWVNSFLSHTSWDSGFSLWITVGIRHRWQSALNGTLLGDHFCRENWSCRMSVKQSMWLGAGGVLPSWEPVVPLGARRGCLTTKTSHHAVLGNFTYHVECLSQRLACAYFQQNIWRTKRKQLDYCVDKIFSR